MQDKIKQINDGLKKIRTAISNQGVVITEDTPLSEYASKINEISRPNITIGQQVFVFYCNAKDNEELEMKIKPSVSWNNEFNAGDVTETIGGGTQAVPNPETDKYLYGLIISIIPGQSTSDEGFSGPRPIPIQGRNGEHGEKGDTGRDGVLVGAKTYHTTLVYHKLTESETVDSVQISKDDIQYHVDSNAPFGPESIKVNSELIVNPESYGTTTLDPSSLTVCAIITYSVMSKVSEYIGNIDAVSKPFVLFGEQIKEQIVEYAINNDRDAVPSEWEETPGILTADNQYLWSRITTVYATGDNKVSDPIIIAQYPKSIVGSNVKYGLSPDINTVPDEGENTFNQYENYTILGSNETTFYSDGTSKEIIQPIAFKGDSGISPVKILAVVPSNEFESGTLSHTNIELQSAIIVDKKTYVGNGTTNPSIGTNDYRTVEGEGVTYYGLDLGQWATPDWNVNDPEKLGYVANRTHYEEIITQTYYEDFIPDVNTGIFQFDVPDGYKTKSLTISIPDTSVDNVTLICSETPNYIPIRAIDPDYNPVLGRLFYQSNLITLDVEGAPLLASPIVDMTVVYNKIVPLDPKFTPHMIEITYADLKALKDQSQLIPGMQYRIIDYETKTCQTDTESAGHLFDLIVTADSINTINCKAKAIQSARDTEGYFAHSDLSKGEIGYDLDERQIYEGVGQEDTIKGVIDSDGSVYDVYDELINGNHFLSALLGGGVSLSSSAAPSALAVRKTSGSFCIPAHDSNKSKYKLYTDRPVDVFIPNVYDGGVYDKALYVAGGEVDFMYDEDKNIVASNNGTPIYKIIYTEPETLGTIGHNTPTCTAYPIRSMKDTLVIQSMYMDGNCVNAIVEYLKTYNSINYTVLVADGAYTRLSVGKLVIVGRKQLIPVGKNNIEFNASEEGHVMDTYQQGNKTEYIHKGTIYRMIDEGDNDCPYDFKNMIMTRVGLDHKIYTFTATAKDGENFYDGSVRLGEYFRNNKMEPYYQSIPTPGAGGITLSDKRRLNINAVIGMEPYTSSLGGGSYYTPHCYNNKFDFNCHTNIVYGCDTQFKNQCVSNTIEGSNIIMVNSGHNVVNGGLNVFINSNSMQGSFSGCKFYNSKNISSEYNCSRSEFINSSDITFNDYVEDCFIINTYNYTTSDELSKKFIYNGSSKY